jgi:hypothetical protein
MIVAGAVKALSFAAAARGVEQGTKNFGNLTSKCPKTPEELEGRSRTSLYLD